MANAPNRMKFSILSVLALFLVMGGGIGCGGGIALQCVTAADCPLLSDICVAQTCQNVCFGVTVGDGSDGSLCNDGTDCDSGDCDFSSATSTCRCRSGGIPNTCPSVDGMGAVAMGGACDNDSDCASDNCCDPSDNALQNPPPGCSDAGNICTCRRSCLEDAVNNGGGAGNCGPVTVGNKDPGACCALSNIDCAFTCDTSTCECF